MYTDISELPTQVRMSLDDEDSRKWMDAYNERNPHTEHQVAEARRHAWKACKDLPSSFCFHAVASVEDVDNDGELIDVESILKHAEDYIRSGGNLQDNHGNYTVGTCWDITKSEVDGKPAVEMWGNLFGGDEVYDTARRAFVKGFNNVSIAGEADHGHYQCDEKGCYVKRTVRQLLEISICRVPSNRHATMIWCNEDARLAKSKDSILLDVENYTLHKDYTTCPILGLRKSLRDAGLDAHATGDAVYAPISLETYERMEPRFYGMGLCPIYKASTGRVYLSPRSTVLERTFKSMHYAGWLDDDGKVLDDGMMGVMRPMRRDALFERRSDGWYLRHERDHLGVRPRRRVPGRAHD